LVSWNKTAVTGVALFVQRNTLRIVAEPEIARAIAQLDADNATAVGYSELQGEKVLR
jgi:hypothetical protein